MKIEIKSLAAQKRFVYEESIKESIQVLKDNLKAEVIETPLTIDISQLSDAHLRLKDKGYKAPSAEIVTAYINQIKDTFDEYSTDDGIAGLLGLAHGRRIREFKSGKREIPYDLWRKLLVYTGRATQEIVPVLGFFKDEPSE